MNHALRACPFCGGCHTEVLERTSWFEVHCLGCGAKGPPLATKLQATSWWNLRRRPKGGAK